MIKPLTIFVMVGEPSGDVLAAEAITELRKQTDRPVELVGVGGDALAALGLKSLFPMSDMTVMGVAEVVPRIPLLLRRIRETAQAVADLKPDLVLSVDAPDYVFRVHKKLKKMGVDVPQVHWVAPTVWAWRPGRAKKIAKFLDHLLVLYPFEPDYFEREGLATTMVGHPVVNRLQTPEEDLRSGLGLSADQPVLVCLPGSRHSEISRLLPIFEDTVRLLAKQLPGLNVLLPTVPHIEQDVKGVVFDWPVPTHVLLGDQLKWQAFATGSAALAASGTVTLELTAAKLPCVVGYRLAPLTYGIAKLMVKAPHISITNMILDERVIPEFVQGDCKPEALADALLPLLTQSQARAAQTARFDEAMSALGAGGPPPASRAASALLDIIEKREKGA